MSINYSTITTILSSAMLKHIANISGEFDFDPDEYDSDEGYYDIEWFIKFVPAIIIYTLTFIFGFFGNLLVIFAILYLKKLQSVTNLFLVSLASADLLLIIFCVPIKVRV